MESHEYLLKHSQEWSEKYPGKYIAIVGDKLVAIGHTELEVFKKAKEKYPDKEVSIAYLPTDEEMVTYVTVGDGSLIPVYSHQIMIQIGDEKFEAMIGFSRRLGIGFNIIGRKDIFERFKVCFDEKEKVVEFI